MKIKSLLHLISWLLLISLCFSLVGCSLQKSEEKPNTSNDPNPSGDENHPSGGSSELSTSILELIATIQEYSSYSLPEGFDPSGLSPSEILAATEDPYSEYFTAEEYLEYSEDLNGNFVGIGVVIDYPNESSIRVLNVFTDSPAEHAGLLPKDIIVGVNGKDVSLYDSLADARDDIVGLPGSTVTLTILRGEAQLDIEIERNYCTKDTVLARIVETGDLKVGYVFITTFDAITTIQFISTVSYLEQQGIDAIVFDLRFNGGGLLRTVCEMLAYLLPDGPISTIDYTSETLKDLQISSSGNDLNYLGSKISTDAYGNPIYVAHQANYPIAILTNEYTASASELFTSSLLDYSQMGTFVPVVSVGSKTFGKGCMQSSFRLSDGSYLKMTIALFNPPTRENFNGTGIPATIEVQDPFDGTHDIYFQDMEDVVLTSAISFIQTLK